MDRARLLALAAMVALPPGCAAESDAVAPRTVVLISVDTLRSDHLPAYGYDGVATPAFDRLAAEGVLFERAYAACPLTLPSHATLFTGLDPAEHGVRDNRDYALPEGAATLAEALGERGWRRGGFVASMVLRRETGVGQGFETWDDAMGPAGQAELFAQRAGAEVVDAASAWIGAVDPGERAFLFVHLYEPHTPYDPPAPFAERYPLAYDGEIAESDRQVGRLIDALERAGRYDDALVILTSDHGEGLGDHGESEHGVFVYRESIQVPLVVRLPRAQRAGERVDDAAGLIDVPATVLARTGRPERFGAGRDLLGARTPRLYYAESMFGTVQYGWAPLRSMTDGTLHFIDAPRPELYDLDADPAELANLLPGRPVPQRFRSKLDALGEGIEHAATIDAETAERLASLGYVGGAPSRGDGPDPKDGIERAERLKRAIARIGDDPSMAAEREVLRLLRDLGVRNQFLVRTAAGNLLRAGRAGAAREALAPFADTGEPATLQLLGQALVELGRPGEARELFAATARYDPDDPAAWLGLGIVDLTLGDLPRAREALERTVRLDDRRAEAWNALGALNMMDRRADEAIACWERAVERDPALADAWFNLARARLQAGQRDRAREALDRYRALVGPDDPDGRRLADRIG